MYYEHTDWGLIFARLVYSGPMGGSTLSKQDFFGLTLIQLSAILASLNEEPEHEESDLSFQEAIQEARKQHRELNDGT